MAVINKLEYAGTIYDIEDLTTKQSVQLLDTTVGNLSDRVDATESSISDIEDDVDQLQTDVGTAQSTADNAQSDASTALTNASTAQSTANNALGKTYIESIVKNDSSSNLGKYILLNTFTCVNTQGVNTIVYGCFNDGYAALADCNYCVNIRSNDGNTNITGAVFLSDQVLGANLHITYDFDASNQLLVRVYYYIYKRYIALDAKVFGGYHTNGVMYAVTDSRFTSPGTIHDSMEGTEITATAMYPLERIDPTANTTLTTASTNASTALTNASTALTNANTALNGVKLLRANNTENRQIFSLIHESGSMDTDTKNRFKSLVALCAQDPGASISGWITYREVSEGTTYNYEVYNRGLVEATGSWTWNSNGWITSTTNVEITSFFVLASGLYGANLGVKDLTTVIDALFNDYFDDDYEDFACNLSIVANNTELSSS